MQWKPCPTVGHECTVDRSLASHTPFPFCSANHFQYAALKVIMWNRKVWLVKLSTPLVTFTWQVSKAPSSSKKPWCATIVYWRSGDMRGSTHRMEEILIDLVGYGLWFCVSQKGGKPVYLCFVWLQDDHWCAACSWCYGLHSISRHLCVLYLKHMHLINDAVYVAGRVSLLSCRFMSPVTWPKCRVEAALYRTYTALPQVALHKVFVTF